MQVLNLPTFLLFVIPFSYFKMLSPPLSSCCVRPQTDCIHSAIQVNKLRKYWSNFVSRFKYYFNRYKKIQTPVRILRWLYSFKGLTALCQTRDIKTNVWPISNFNNYFAYLNSTGTNSLRYPSPCMTLISSNYVLSHSASIVIFP